MGFIAAVVCLCALFSPSLLLASYQPPFSGNAFSADLILEQAIAQRLIAGGVVVVGNHDGILYSASRGQVSSQPGALPLDDRTMFDLASLTKVAATAPAVMLLLDEGTINLSDPLSRWFPEFARARQGEITVLHLLTHTSGLTDFELGRRQSMRSVVRKAAGQRFFPLSGRFNYADINFILLGELVRRATGQTLDEFCRRRIYLPLKLSDTRFRPAEGLATVIAPTAGFRSGVVGDSNARRLGSVAGHAGLFSSAYDLSRYARLILGGGMIDNTRIFSEQVIAQMTTPYLCNHGQVWRGLGWDMASPFSAPKGKYFSKASFGHTGYNGSSIWIDPRQDSFVILLTRRIDYHDPHSFAELRGVVSNLASADWDLPGDALGSDRLRNAPLATALLVRPNSLPVTGDSVGKLQCQLLSQSRSSRRHKSAKSAMSSRKKRKVAKG
jgi:CubicO group peptidase (beta-lactamase class C family)